MKHPRSKSNSFGAVVVLISCFLPGSDPAWAGMVSSIEASEKVSQRDRHLQSIQKVLQSEAVKERLSEVGLTGQEIEARLAALSDSELVSFAQKVEEIQKGKGVCTAIAIGVGAYVLCIWFFIHVMLGF